MHLHACIIKQYVIQTCGGVKIQLHAFFISAWDGGVWLLYAPAALPPRIEPRYPLHRRMGGPQSRYKLCDKQNNSALPGNCLQYFKYCYKQKLSVWTCKIKKTVFGKYVCTVGVLISSLVKEMCALLARNNLEETSCDFSLFLWINLLRHVDLMIHFSPWWIYASRSMQRYGGGGGMRLTDVYRPATERNYKIRASFLPAHVRVHWDPYGLQRTSIYQRPKTTRTTERTAQNKHQSRAGWCGGNTRSGFVYRRYPLRISRNVPSILIDRLRLSL
jgi:hypothetical protein